MEHVYKLHGMPSSIISDRDRVFTSNLWRELFGLAGVQLRMSSANHPRRTAKLRESISAWRHSCAVSFMPALLSGLPGCHARSSGITRARILLGRSPFEVLYGYAPRHFGIDPASAVLVLIYQLGSGSVRSCRILCANISCVLRTE